MSESHAPRSIHRLTREEWDAAPPQAKLAQGDRCFIWMTLLDPPEHDRRPEQRWLAEIEFVDRPELPAVWRCVDCRLTIRLQEETLPPNACFACGGEYARASVAMPPAF